MELPNRKSLRLTEYDYSQNGVYFVTICTKGRIPLLGRILPVGATIGRPLVALTAQGNITATAIHNLSIRYPNIRCDKYVIMPNHIHLIVTIHNTEGGGRPMVAPTLSTVIQQMKGYVSKQVGYSVWQKGYYDHVIRSDTAHLNIWQYIDTNPQKWTDDCYYVPPPQQ